jgi:hypothetical protein
LECWRLDWRVDDVEWVESGFDEDLVDFVEEVLDAVVLGVVYLQNWILLVSSWRFQRNSHHNKSNLTRSDESGDEKLIELVETLQVGCVAAPLVFVDEIKRCVCDELVEMSMVFFLEKFKRD